MSALNAAAAAIAIAAACFLISRGNNYQVFIIVTVGLTAIVGIGLNVLLGLNGQISLGHVAFYAIGAYTVGIQTTNYEWSFWPAFILSGVIAGLAGMLLAIPALKVRGPYLAMVTIAFGFVVEQSAAEWQGVTGGWNGLSGIPGPSVFGTEISERGIAFLTLALVVMATAAFAWLSRSVWGNAMRAVRDSESASVSIGLDPTLVRTAAFGISAVAAGLAGGVYASISNFISPESFPFFQSILFLLVVMLGGADRVLGPIVGTLVVVLLPELLATLGQYRLLFVGVLMLAVLRLAPTGLVGLIASVLPRKERDTLAKERSDIGRFLAAGASGQALAVRDLSVNFGGVRAVRDLTLEAQPGAITSIIGPNGAGKSTALNVICGFYRPDAGTVRLGDQIVSALRAHQIPRAGIARTYQTSQLFESMSVIDNVVIALRRGRLAPHFLTGGKHGDEAEIAESLLAFVGYRGALGRPADALAHVDKRLVEIARALAVRPSVLALDEPAAGLNAEDTAAIGALLRKLAAVGMTVILVEHDMDLVMGVSNHVIVLDAGAMIAEGTPAQVVADPAVLEAYLGAGEQAERGRKQPVAIAAQKPLMTVSALSAGYGAATVVRRADFEIAEGELVAVLGANGAGKTTLMRALSGLLRPIEGEVRFLGERIDHFPGDRIARAGLLLVPEGRQVFPELSVTDNLRLGAYARRSAEEASMIENLLTRFPALKARQYQRAGLLSGGEQQMLAIARGLMARPQVLMLDEPSLGLAPKLLENLYDLLAALRDEGITILLVDQMAQLALSVADRAYVLQSGAFTHSGTAREVAQDPALVKAYLGGHGALL